MREIVIVSAILLSVAILCTIAYFSIPMFTKLLNLSKNGRQSIKSKEIVYEIPSENKSIKLSEFTNHLKEHGSAYFR